MTKDVHSYNCKKKNTEKTYIVKYRKFNSFIKFNTNGIVKDKYQCIDCIENFSVNYKEV